VQHIDPFGFDVPRDYDTAPVHHGITRRDSKPKRNIPFYHQYGKRILPLANRSATSIVSRTAGDKPSLISSRMNTFGKMSKARPIASILCSQPLRVPAACESLSPSTGKSANTRSQQVENLVKLRCAIRRFSSHSEIGEKKLLLGRIADTQPRKAVRTPTGDLTIVERYFSFLGSQQSNDPFQERTLSCSVSPHKA